LAWPHPVADKRYEDFEVAGPAKNSEWWLDNGSEGVSTLHFALEVLEGYLMACTSQSVASAILTELE
jgi:hypothetical protein